MKSKPREYNTCTNNTLHKFIVSIAFIKSSFIFTPILPSFSLLYSLVYSSPVVSVLSEERWLFSRRLRSECWLIFSSKLKSVTDGEAFVQHGCLFLPISNRNPLQLRIKRLLWCGYMMSEIKHLNRFKMMRTENTKEEKIYLYYYTEIRWFIELFLEQPLFLSTSVEEKTKCSNSN